jgi:hypothetical protein
MISPLAVHFTGLQSRCPAQIPGIEMCELNPLIEMRVSFAAVVPPSHFTFSRANQAIKITLLYPFCCPGGEN